MWSIRAARHLRRGATCGFGLNVGSDNRARPTRWAREILICRSRGQKPSSIVRLTGFEAYREAVPTVQRSNWPSVSPAFPADVIRDAALAYAQKLTAR